MEYPKSIIVALAAIRDDVGHVEKDGRNTHFKYDYASETALARAIRPLLAKHGLVILQSVATHPPPFVDGKNTHVTLEFTLAHTDGSVWPEKIRVFATGADPGDKGAYKANTGGYKYLLNRLFMVDTGDDPEIHQPERTQPQQPTAPAEQPAVSPFDKPIGFGAKFPGKTWRWFTEGSLNGERHKYLCQIADLEIDGAPEDAADRARKCIGILEQTKQADLAL